MPFESQVDQEERRYDGPPVKFFALLMLFCLGVWLHSQTEWWGLTSLTLIAGLCALFVYVRFSATTSRGVRNRLP